MYHCHILLVYYHAPCSIAYLACCADMGGIGITFHSEVKKCQLIKQFTEEGGDGREREVRGTGKWEKEEVNRESIHLDRQHVTEFLTMFAYEWYCMTMCTCIILIVNLPAE